MIIFTYELKRAKVHVACFLTLKFKTNDFSRLQAVTYTVNVVIFIIFLLLLERRD